MVERSSETLAPARGLLNHRISMEHFDLIRIPPSEDLAPFVENHWIIFWDLTGKPDYTQENLPHPSQHIALDPCGDVRSGVFGIQTGKFVYRLSGSGRVFGTKFRPGAFHAFLRRDVSELTGGRLPVEAVFSRTNTSLDEEFQRLNDPERMAGPIEAMLRAAEPELDHKARDARHLVELIAGDREILTVATLARLTGNSSRGLQRLFEAYVGIGPKWVIDRYRILEAVDALNAGGDLNLTELAHALGYFDQAHFTRAFAALAGRPPSHYLKGR